MATVYYDTNANLKLMQGKKIAIIGLGNQGHVHALNLRDNGCNVIICSRLKSENRERAIADGFQVMTPTEAAGKADVIMLLMPDQDHREIFECDIRSGLAPGKLLLTGHGFSLHYNCNRRLGEQLLGARLVQP